MHCVQFEGSLVDCRNLEYADMFGNSDKADTPRLAYELVDEQWTRYGIVQYRIAQSDNRELLLDLADCIGMGEVRPTMDNAWHRLVRPDLAKRKLQKRDCLLRERSKNAIRTAKMLRFRWRRTDA